MNIKRSSSDFTKFFVAMALVISCLENPETLFAQDEPTTVTTPVKVMSFNIRYGAATDGENHWKNRSYLVAETIKMFDPDLLGAQEVLKFQADFLQETLPDYGFHGVGRDDGTAKGEYVPIMYKRDRFQMTDS